MSARISFWEAWGRLQAEEIATTHPKESPRLSRGPAELVQHRRDTQSSPWALQWILSSPSPSQTIQFGAVPAVHQEGHKRAGMGLREHTADGSSSVPALKGESSRDITKRGISRTKTCPIHTELPYRSPTKHSWVKGTLSRNCPLTRHLKHICPVTCDMVTHQRERS